MGRGRSKGILSEPIKDEQQEVVENPVIEEPVEEAPVEKTEEKAPEVENENKAKEVTTAALPEKVIALLRVFNAYDELYITPWGGVFTSPQAHVKDAVLYKNPFYKK